MTKYLKFILPALLIVGAWAWYQSRLPKYGSGEMAPDFNMTIADGTSLRLSDLRGKMVVLQFWGSWCGPCRRENPGLADLYKKYKESGLEVVSIAIERAPANWQAAIQKDGLAWKYHVMEPGNFSGPIAQLYNIHEIPTHFLINKEGKIIGLNLSKQVLGQMLNEQLLPK